MPKRSGVPTPKQPPPKDRAGLHAEVKAFASSLGLSAADSNGFNDSDFRPEVAKRKFSDKGGQQKRTREHAGGDGSLGAVADGKKRARTDSKAGRRTAPPRSAQPVPQQHRQRPLDEKAVAALKSREWKEGVGPRPGASADSARSLCHGRHCRLKSDH